MRETSAGGAGAGAETYFEDRQRDPVYAAADGDTRQRIADVDEIMRTIDRQRVARERSKAELARRIGVRPEAVRPRRSSAA